jgi:hypothetical protein
MDVAKLIIVRSKVPDKSWEELDDSLGGDRFIPKQLPPVIAIPTTAGTGSEIGRAAVLTVASTGSKTVIFAPSMLPRVAILDPELTVSLPPGPTAATGLTRSRTVSRPTSRKATTRSRMVSRSPGWRSLHAICHGPCPTERISRRAAAC